MRLAILMSNTDESAFAQNHPKDGAKWQALLTPLCPDCTFTVYAVKDGAFPDDLSRYDGAIITGSPASVHDLDPWLPRLFDLIRDAVAQRLPLFGACFGHQAIALALGGAVTPNPGGWVFGVTETQLSDGDHIRLHAAHSEQVSRAPEGARVTATNPDCPVGGFAIDNHVLTTQYHPEITPPFMAALIDEMEDHKPPEVIASARDSMHQTAENTRFAHQVLTFFHQSR